MEDNINIDCCSNYLEVGLKELDLNVFDITLNYKGDPAEILKDLLMDSNTEGYAKIEKLDEILESYKGTWVLEKFKERYEKIIECLDDYKLDFVP